jgi:hypothetical protein
MSDTSLAFNHPVPGTAVLNRLVDGLRSFRALHDGATAVIEYIGRRGARIVLVGEDGAWGEQPAPATDVARAACERAGVPVENGWFRELNEAGGGAPRGRHAS